MGDVVPDRPVGVPPGARYFPPADDVSALAEFHCNRPGRGYLRVRFPFVLWTIQGPMRDCRARCITARPTRYGESKCFTFSTHREPVPGVWAWTLADERANPTPPGPLVTGDENEETPN